MAGAPDPTSARRGPLEAGGADGGGSGLPVGGGTLALVLYWQVSPVCPAPAHAPTLGTSVHTVSGSNQGHPNITEDHPGPIHPNVDVDPNPSS